MTDSAGSFIWYELMAPDPHAAKAFYERVFDWTIEAEPSGAIDYRMITATLGNVGGVLTLTPEMFAGGARAAWVGYVCVDDVDAALTALEAAGGRTLMPAHNMPGIGRFALAADPQGAPFYLMRPAPNEGAPPSPVFAPGELGHVAWNELSTVDQAGAIGFYSGLFGWRFDERLSMGPMGDYVFIHHGATRLGGVMQQDAVPTAWCFYTQVADIAAAAEAVRAGGGQVIMGPAPTPEGGQVIVARDPQGAVFGAVQGG